MKVVMKNTKMSSTIGLVGLFVLSLGAVENENKDRHSSEWKRQNDLTPRHEGVLHGSAQPTKIQSRPS
jgi:hypothetical protein